LVVDTFGDLSKMEIVEKKGTSCRRLRYTALGQEIQRHCGEQKVALSGLDRKWKRTYEKVNKKIDNNNSKDFVTKP